MSSTRGFSWIHKEFRRIPVFICCRSSHNNCLLGRYVGGDVAKAVETSLPEAAHMLTAKEIENDQPRQVFCKLFDGGGLGLYLQAYPVGGKLWRLAYSFEGKRHIKSLGGWSDIILKEAREKAVAFKKDISEGIDPAKAEHEAPATFRDVSREWASRFLPGLADITRRQTLAKLEKKS
jgi:hypothetical protein